MAWQRAFIVVAGGWLNHRVGLAAREEQLPGHRHVVGLVLQLSNSVAYGWPLGAVAGGGRRVPWAVDGDDAHCGGAEVGTLRRGAWAEPGESGALREGVVGRWGHAHSFHPEV